MGFLEVNREGIIPNQKLECFVLCLKIIDVSLKTDMRLEVNCLRNSKIALKDK